jgi:hypothetical protein
MTTQIEIQTLTDELGRVESQLKGLDALITHREALRKQLSELADQSEGEVTFTGQAYMATFSKNPVNRELKPEQYGEFLQIVGVEGFLKSSKVSVTSASKLLSEVDQARLFTSSKGSRRLKSVVAIPKTATIETQAAEAFYASLAGIVGSVSPTNKPSSL